MRNPIVAKRSVLAEIVALLMGGSAVVACGPTSPGSGEGQSQAAGDLTSVRGVPVPRSAFGLDLDSSTWPAGVSNGFLGKRPGTSWNWIITDGCDPETQKVPGSDPDNPCYHWVGLDAVTLDAQAHGVPTDYDFDGAPSYAYGSSGKPNMLLNEKAVSDFATAIAKRYASVGTQPGCTSSSPQCHGVIQYYEEWNEVNDNKEWADTWSNLALQSGWIYKAIKAVDPGARVGAPNMGMGVYQPTSSPTHIKAPDPTVWLDNYLANGGAQYADFVGYHSYGSNTVKYGDNGVYCVAELGCDAATDKLHCSAQPILNAYNAFRAVMAKHGLGAAPIVNTEGGFGDDSDSNCASPIDTTACLKLSDQPAYVGRYLAMLASTYSDGHGVLQQWYAYDGNWGTLNGTYGQNPKNVTAWNVANAWVTGARFSSQCSPVAAGSTLFLCELTLASGFQAQIVFNDGKGAVTTYAPPSWATQFQPLLGSMENISRALAVGSSPVLIKGGSVLPGQITTSFLPSGAGEVSYRETLAAPPGGL
jgi:hypothetical protein